MTARLSEGINVPTALIGGTHVHGRNWFRSIHVALSSLVTKTVSWQADIYRLADRRAGGRRGEVGRGGGGGSITIRGLRLGRYRVLRNLRHSLWARSHGRTPHPINCPEERARALDQKGRERICVRPTLGVFQRQHWGKVLLDGLECIQAFLSTLA